MERELLEVVDFGNGYTLEEVHSSLTFAGQLVKSVSIIVTRWMFHSLVLQNFL